MKIPDKIESQKDLVQFLSQLDRNKLKIKSLVVEFWLDEEQIEKEGITLTEFSMD